MTRVVIVTGGARGIGRGIAQRLVDDGAKVCIVDTKPGEPLAGAKLVRADVSREADVRRAVAAAVKWGGRLDGVVNNAGVADPEIGPVDKVSLRVWQRYLDVNLTGAFLVAKHAVRHLRKTSGAIVNIASTRAEQSEPNTIAYAASKGGLVALTHALAISLGPDVRVNCINPGWIDTGHAPLRAIDHAAHPVGRVGRPADIAGLCAWLLSDEAGFATGATFTLDGGMTRKMIYPP
jgi:NAD(P)-dependent dehydrogenase (short-subunit alcohol dehydrogenase family)